MSLRQRVGRSPVAKAKALSALRDTLSWYAAGYRLGVAGEDLGNLPSDPLLQRAYHAGHQDGNLTYACSLAQMLVSTRQRRNAVRA